MLSCMHCPAPFFAPLQKTHQNPNKKVMLDCGIGGISFMFGSPWHPHESWQYKKGVQVMHVRIHERVRTFPHFLYTRQC